MAMWSPLTESCLQCTTTHNELLCNYGVHCLSALKGKKSLQEIKLMNMKSWIEQIQFHTKINYLKYLMKSEMSIRLHYSSIQTVVSA